MKRRIFGLDGLYTVKRTGAGRSGLGKILVPRKYKRKGLWSGDASQLAVIVVLSCRGEINEQLTLEPRSRRYIFLCAWWHLDEWSTWRQHWPRRHSWLWCRNNPSTFQTVPLRLHHLPVVLASIQEHAPSLALLLSGTVTFSGKDYVTSEVTSASSWAAVVFKSSGNLSCELVFSGSLEVTS